MILQDIKKYIPSQKFQLDQDSLQKTWEYYCEQYHNASIFFINISRQCKNTTNAKFMPIMEIIRHSYELLLKNEIYRKSMSVPETHSLKEMADTLNIAIDCPILCKDVQGDFFRYPFDINGNLHFKTSPIEVFNDINDYINKYNRFTPQGKKDLPLEESKRIKSELTFYPRECYNLGITSTQYDEAITELLKGIDEKKIEVNQVWLPLLFLIRQSLELRLKFELQNLGIIIEKQELIYHEHRLHRMWEELRRILDPSINKIKDITLKGQSENFLEESIKYVDRIRSLDANSYILRYPKNKNGSEVNLQYLDGNILKEILQLYEETDSFLSFATKVLINEGVLIPGDDII